MKSFFFSLLFLFFLLNSTFSQVCQKNQLAPNLQQGLVAYYPFCGNLNDISGNNFNGTAQAGTVPFINDRSGNPGSAVQLGGGFITANSAVFNFQRNQNFSISIWFTKDNNAPSGRLLSTECPEGNFRMGAGFNGVYAVQYGDYINDTVPIGQWTHLVYTYENRSEKVYINGKLKYTNNDQSIEGLNYCAPFTIGAKASSAFDRWIGKADDLAIYNRVLTQQEVNQLYTNATCSGSLNYNVFPDVTNIAGKTTILDAGAGFSSYLWNTGATQQSINVNANGIYKVTVTDQFGCTASDSTDVNLFFAEIQQNDTTICLGSSITLSIDSTNSTISTACASAQLPTSLKNGLVAYYPFCGNANDASGNGNNGIVNGASLTTDRFGNSNSAYYFNGNAQYISVVSNNLPKNDRTVSAWINVPVSNYIGMLMAYGGTGICGTSYFIGMNHRGTDKFMVSGHCANNETQAAYVPPANVWVNIVAVSSSSGTKIYANGILVGSSAAFFSNTSGINMLIGSSIDFAGINPYLDGNGLRWLGKIDDFILWNRALSEQEVKSLYINQKSVSWSTGATSNSITVKPTQTTKYFVTVSDGVSSFRDSVTVNVADVTGFNPLSDTLRACSNSSVLDAGSGLSNILWSNGATSQTISPTVSGQYKFSAINSNGCTVSDSAYLSLISANILQNDTTICTGSSISLSVDTVLKVINTVGSSLPTNLKSDLVAYYPFNGNANDESGNNNHATVYNARLTTDRFGRANSAYAFSPTDRSSIIPGILNTSMVNSFTYSVWVKPLNAIVVPPQGQAGNAASGFPNNTCVIHPIHGQNYGPASLNTGTGVYVGTNGVYLEEHSESWEAVPISHQMDLTGWHLINIVYENKVPTLYIDGVLIKKGIPSLRQIYASLGPDAFPGYGRSGIGAGYIPATGTTQFFNGDIDDIFFYKRALSSNEVTQIYNGALSVKWSTGDTTSRITVTPTTTTKYFVTVSDGITSCTDSILIKVDNLTSFNPLPDTISQCGKSINLDAGGNFQTYNWSNGDTSKRITVTQSGKYNVSVKTVEGCSATDSTVVSLLYVNIGNKDTTICEPIDIKLQLTDTLVSKKGGWELLIPASSFTFSETNFRESGFDPENAKLYSVLKNGSVNRFYVFDLNTNSVQTLESASPPGEIYDYVYDFTNSRIIGTRVGRDRMFSIPLTGGTWTPYGNGSFDAESYGCAAYWNPVTRRPGFFGGYGFFSVKNWVWENNGNAGWQNVFANTSNCQPPKRTGQIARNKLGDKLFIFSGQGSCDGNQRASSCSISQPWATDVGIFCWLKDLWELDLNTYTFKNILPPNSPSIVNEGGFTYDYNGDVFYNVGGYKPLPTYAPATASNLDYEVEVYRYRRGVDNGFELLPVDGNKPPVVKLSQYSGRTYFDTKYNRIIWARNDGIWALNLGSSGSTSYKYKWSTGDSTTSITVKPTKTTTYYVSITDGITTCTDSIKVTVELPSKGVRYPTQDIIINRPTELAARNFGKTYLWSPDVQLNSPRIVNPIVTPIKQQEYTVRITTEAGCVTVDTVLVRVFPDRNIYLPEGFTPDGDGRNDRLYPIPVGIREIRTFRVYNRWGTLLYDNRNANISTGWDGTYLGIAQPMESYVWVAEGIDVDGKFIRRTGNTILIR